MEEFDYNKLRSDLIDYYGAAIAVGNFMAVIELSFIENCSDEELIAVAINNGFDLNNYKNNKIR